MFVSHLVVPVSGNVSFSICYKVLSTDNCNYDKINGLLGLIVVIVTYTDV